jgi:hypothetical protein
VAEVGVILFDGTPMIKMWRVNEEGEGVSREGRVSRKGKVSREEKVSREGKVSRNMELSRYLQKPFILHRVNCLGMIEQ